MTMDSSSKGPITFCHQPLTLTNFNRILWCPNSARDTYELVLKGSVKSCRTLLHDRTIFYGGKRGDRNSGCQNMKYICHWWTDKKRGPYNCRYLAALHFFVVAGKHDSRDIKIYFYISRLSCTLVTPELLRDELQLNEAIPIKWNK